MGRILVAGIGNKYMGDDGFGPRVVEALLARDLPENAEARDVGLCGITLAPELGDYDRVIFADAVNTGGKPGTIYRTEIKAEEVEEMKPGGANIFNLSIHETRLEELLSFAKAIGTLPPTNLVIGCEVRDAQLGEEMSPEVATAVHTAVEIILDLLWRGERK
ncbi:MAG: hydrogenase maturation protease [Candidatus Methanospirareceae archaeon]